VCHQISGTCIKLVVLKAQAQHLSRKQTAANGAYKSATFLPVRFRILPSPVTRVKANPLIVKADQLWDGNVLGLQVTNLSEKTMELRCLMSSADSGKSFDLRCNVRERMTAYIQQHYPNAFPTTRFSIAPVKSHPKATTIAMTKTWRRSASISAGRSGMTGSTTRTQVSMKIARLGRPT
jgi:hypothetical protein